MNTVTRAAPGKLFIAGEHAVTEPDQEAVLVAVNRYLDVTLEGSDHRPELVGPQWSYVSAARDVLEAVAAAHDVPCPPCSVTTRSSLDDPGSPTQPSRKYGLGSSGAATVATVRAFDQWLGLNLGPEALLRAALVATWWVNPTASGADVATGLVGGWTWFRSPHRVTVDAAEPDAIAGYVMDGPGEMTARLPAPVGMDVAVGWTGSPASTVSIVQAVRTAGIPQRFLEESHDGVAGVVHGLRNGAPAEVMDGIRGVRRGLVGLAESTGVAIETPKLAELIDIAQRRGYAAKSSGAGGGDCGVALGASDVAEAAGVRADWERSGIVPLELEVAPAGGEDNE